MTAALLLVVAMTSSAAPKAKDPDALASKARAAVAKKDFKKAEAAWGELVRLKADDAGVLYNHAAALARLKQKDKAMAQLEAAVAHGFTAAEYLAQDPDLTPLHEHARWAALLEKAQANEAAARERRELADAALAAAEEALTDGFVENARAELAKVTVADAAEPTRYYVLLARAAETDEARAAELEQALARGLVDPGALLRSPELEAFLRTDKGEELLGRVTAARNELQRNVTWERAGLDEGPLVIGLHGYGESAGLLCAHLKNAMPKSRIVCPPGPHKAEGGGRGWVDLQRTQAVLDVVHKATVRGADRPLLVGFSQGGWLGLREVLSRPERYRAAIVIGTSRFEPPSDKALEAASKSGLRVIFVAGSADPAAMRAARKGYDALLEAGIAAEKLFAVGLSHELPPLPVLQEARKFIDAP